MAPLYLPYNVSWIFHDTVIYGFFPSQVGKDRFLFNFLKLFLLVKKPIKVEKEEPSIVFKDEHRKHKHKHKDSSREKSRHKKKKVHFLVISATHVLCNYELDNCYVFTRS